jgi:hypothetical protein
VSIEPICLLCVPSWYCVNRTPWRQASSGKAHTQYLSYPHIADFIHISPSSQLACYSRGSHKAAELCLIHVFPLDVVCPQDLRAYPGPRQLAPVGPHGEHTSPQLHESTIADQNRASVVAMPPRPPVVLTPFLISVTMPCSTRRSGRTLCWCLVWGWRPSRACRSTDPRETRA